MFDKLKQMTLSCWRMAGEQSLADTFCKSYLDNDLFNKWRYNVSGIPGCIPQNNSHERSNLDTKGCASFSGIIKSGRNMTAMLNNEFPRLIYVNSIERTEVERNFPILDEKKTMRSPLFDYFLKFDKLVDCVPYQHGFLINRKYSLGEPINAERVKFYEDSLAGNFEFQFSQRSLFYSRVNELCFVSKQQLDPKREPFFTGSCFHFYNHLSCHHAAVLQESDKLHIFAKKISQEKQGRKTRRKVGLERVNNYHLRKMAEEHARLTSIVTTTEMSPETIHGQVIPHPVIQPEDMLGLA